MLLHSMSNKCAHASSEISHTLLVHHILQITIVFIVNCLWKFFFLKFFFVLFKMQWQELYLNVVSTIKVFYKSFPLNRFSDINQIAFILCLFILIFCFGHILFQHGCSLQKAWTPDNIHWPLLFLMSVHTVNGNH